MSEPNVQVPVSLIERAVLNLVNTPWPNDELIEALKALPQPTAGEDPKPSLCARLDPHETHATSFRVWAKDGYYDVPGRCPGVSATPPSIADMVPGTTFDCPERWTVGPPTLQGRQWAFRSGEGRYLDEFDPSTIRDVTPPAVTT